MNASRPDRTRGKSTANAGQSSWFAWSVIGLVVGVVIGGLVLSLLGFSVLAVTAVELLVAVVVAAYWFIQRRNGWLGMAAVAGFLALGLAPAFGHWLQFLAVLTVIGFLAVHLWRHGNTPVKRPEATEVDASPASPGYRVQPRPGAPLTGDQQTGPGGAPDTGWWNRPTK